MQRILPVLILLISSTFCCSDVSAQKLGAGVLNVIPPVLDIRDSYSIPLQLPGVDATQFDGNYVPNKKTLFGQTQSVVFFRDVWQYEFAFLGLRQVRLSVTQADGVEKPQNFWYMVYRIRNVGKNISFEDVKENPEFEHIKKELKRDKADFVAVNKFVPRFYLEGWVKEPGQGYVHKVYRDQIRPEVLKKIQFLEDPNLPLLDTVQMMNAELPVIKSPSDPGVWGVAIWGDVNPSIDYVSVYASGLTNAYRMQRNADGEITFRRKTLQLNFWRPGDAVAQERDRVDYGIPLVDQPNEQIEICKRYDLPGPLMRGYLDSPKADQHVLIAEIDGEVNLKDFQSALAPELDQGKLPKKLIAAFADMGVQVPADTAVNTVIPGKKWSFMLTAGDQTESYSVILEPQYWEKDFEGIRFIKSLDSLWIYR